MIKAKCPMCGSEYPLLHPSQMYCGPACAKEAHTAQSYKHTEAYKHKKRPSHVPHTVRVRERPFVAWDGEGEDGKYTLLASSEAGRAPLVNRDGLSTNECLDYLLDGVQRDVNHIWFSFGYDVSMMLHDIPLRGKVHSLEQLHKGAMHRTRHDGYTIEYLPRRILTIRRKDRSYRAFDVFQFFQTSFEKSVETWLGETPDILKQGKQAREQFRQWSMEDIIAYNQCELDLLVVIMERLQQAIIKAGLQLKSYHGPGALASEWLAHHPDPVRGAKAYMKDVQPDMKSAVMRAYFGGRVENAAWGRTGRLYHYDINSAYPDSFRWLPDLSVLKWELQQDGLWGDYCLVHVKWNCAEAQRQHHASGRPFWGPFPYREKASAIRYSVVGEGWYWGVEVKAAMNRLDGIEVIEFWQPKGVLRFPFMEDIEHIAEHRLALKRAGDPSNVPLKLVMNSLYGKVAQKKGYFNPETLEFSKPAYQNYIWAGFITAHCRAEICNAIAAANSMVVCVMTDSIYSLVDMEGRLDFGPGLGQWTYDDEVKSGLFCGAGLSAMYNAEGNMIKKEYKTRGFSGTSNIDYEGAYVEWEFYRENGIPSGDYNPEVLVRHFVGIATALTSERYAQKYGLFIEEYKTLGYVPEKGDSKRVPLWGGSGVELLSLPDHPHLHFMLSTGTDFTAVSAEYRPGGAEERFDDEVLLELAFEEDEP